MAKGKGRKPRGWEGDPVRHALARHGVETTQPDFGQVYQRSPEFFEGQMFARGLPRIGEIEGAGEEAGLSGAELDAFVDEYARWGYSSRPYDLLGAARMYREEGRIEHGLPASGMSYDDRVKRAGIKAGLVGADVDGFQEAYLLYGYSDSPWSMEEAAQMYMIEGHIEGQPPEEEGY